VEDMHDILEVYTTAWRLFQEEGWHSIHEYIKDYIGGNGASYLDWRFLVRAVEQAEHGYGTAFDQLLDPDYVYDGTLPLGDPVMAVSEPLKARWEQTYDDCPHSAEDAGRDPAGRASQFRLFL